MHVSGTWQHPHVPYDVLVDPVSLPDHPVLGQKLNTHQALQDESNNKKVRGFQTPPPKKKENKTTTKKKKIAKHKPVWCPEFPVPKAKETRTGPLKSAWCVFSIEGGVETG